MRRRNLNSLAVFLSSVVISLFIPVAVNAADTNIVDDHVTITEESKCVISDPLTDKKRCGGHTITGTGTNTIKVAGNDTSKDNSIVHKITIKDLHIEKGRKPVADMSALSIVDNANVELIIEGSNELESEDGLAGIFVESGSNLIIHSKDDTTKHSLTVTGGERGAGIGGQGNTPSGDITIKSGKITATGGAMAAGIGSGDTGQFGNIEIAGGEVKAHGGPGKEIKDSSSSGSGNRYAPGGSGIGYGGDATRMENSATAPTVTLSGGTIETRGGENSNTTPSYFSSGIDCIKLLSSEDGAADITATISKPTIMDDDFNGIIWQLPEGEVDGDGERKGSIHGSAFLGRDIAANERLIFMSGATLSTPIKIDPATGKTVPLKCAGVITAVEGNNNYIIGEIVPVGQGSIYYKAIGTQVILQKQDFTIPTNLVYTGADLTSDAIKPNPTREVNGKPADVISTGWNYTISSSKFPDENNPRILKAGGYTVTYSNPKYPENGFNFDIKVDQALLKDVTIKEIDSQTFNNKEHKPELTVTYNNYPVIAGSDYTATYTDNKPVGTATVTLKAAGGNFKDDKDNKKIATFAIEPASLTGDNADVTISSTKGTYNGNEHKPDITVSSKIVLDENDKPTELTENTDYIVTASRDGKETKDYRSAGKIVYTIQGKGNYQGTAKTLEYEIEPKTITINPNSQIKISNKPYDGNNEFKLSGVEFNSEVISADRSEVKLEVGYVSSANVGKYDQITFDPKDLSGSKGSNYTFAKDAGLPLNPVVEIEQVKPEVRKPKASYVPNDAQNAFICTVEIDKQPGIDYEFKMDEEGQWMSGTPNEDKTKSISPDFADIAPLSKHTFYVRSIGTTDGTGNVMQVDMDNVEIEFKKLPNPNKAPESCALEFAPNSDGRTFTATITPAGLEGTQYCIKPTDAEDSELIILDSNTYANCAPLTSYTAYIRYPGNDVYEPSEAATATAETGKAPLADAKPQYTPVLTRINATNPTDEYMTAELRAMYGNMSDVLSDMAKRLSEDYADIYSHDRIEYYELNLMVQRYNPDGTLSEPTPATPDDFKQEDGSYGSITVQVKASDLPSGTNPNRNTYAVAHMFASNIGSHFAGDIETSPGTPGGGGISFDVNGTSPIAIAWSAATNNEDPGNEDPGNDDPGNDDPGNEDPGTEDPGNDDPGTDPGDTNNPGNDNPNNNNNNNNNGNTDNNGGTGSTDNNSNGNGNADNNGNGGTDANGNGTAGNSAVDALKSAAASLLPKTGDTSKIIMWAIVAVVACTAVVAVILNKAKNKKAAAASKTTVSAKKPAVATAKKSTAATAKKSSTTKKTTTTKKGR